MHYFHAKNLGVYTAFEIVSISIPHAALCVDSGGKSCMPYLCSTMIAYLSSDSLIKHDFLLTFSNVGAALHIEYSAMMSH